MRYTHRILRIVVVSALAVLQVTAPSSAQTQRNLYLVTGFATEKYPAKVGSGVMAVDEESKRLLPIADLVPSDVGTDFILVDHDRRMVVVGGPNGAPNQLTILNMDAPATPRTLRSTSGFGPPASYLMEAFLSDGPNGGVLPLLRYAPLSGPGMIVGINLSGPNPSTSQLSWQDYRRARTEGFWSPVDTPAFLAVVPKEGRLLFRPTESDADLGIPAPADLKEATDRLRVAVNTDSMVVLSRYPAEVPAATADNPGMHTLYVYNKQAATWQTVTFPGSVASVRSFGTWIASARAERKRALSHARIVEADPRRERQSPGGAFRGRALNPKERVQDQLILDSLYQGGDFYYPGELYLFDTRSQQQYTIKTEQGDSEVLLVDGNTVYYRVNNALFRATIGKTTIENPIAMASGEAVQLSHWAFLGPAVQ